MLSTCLPDDSITIINRSLHKKYDKKKQIKDLLSMCFSAERSNERKCGEMHIRSCPHWGMLQQIIRLHLFF